MTEIYTTHLVNFAGPAILATAGFWAVSFMKDSDPKRMVRVLSVMLLVSALFSIWQSARITRIETLLPVYERTIQGLLQGDLPQVKLPNDKFIPIKELWKAVLLPNT